MSTTLAAGLAPLGGIEEVRIDWRWTPAWRPADMTNSGREQLRAIGFTISPAPSTRMCQAEGVLAGAVNAVEPARSRCGTWTPAPGTRLDTWRAR